MATIKAYTDIEQSKKLAEILPLKSADMHYATWTILDDGFIVSPNQGSTIENLQEDYGNQIIPCWSLASLLGVLPEIDDTSLILEKVKAEDGYDGYYYHIEYKDKILIPYSKTPVDACVEMIIKLKERDLL